MALKRLIVALMTVAVVLSFTGCGSNVVSDKPASGSNEKGNNAKYSIVTTIFPEYDWVKEILGDQADNFDVTMLLDNGVDLHSFQPTTDDMMKIANCDLFIYVGGESDHWVDDALSEATNKNMKVINLLDTLGTSVKEEEVVEGMQEEDEHEHEHGAEEAEEDEHEHDAEEAEEDEHEHDAEEAEEDEHEHDAEEAEEDEHHDHEEGPEYDEHVWLSLKNTKALVPVIADNIAAIDSANKDSYTSNANAYVDKLDELDNEYQQVVSSASKDTILFGDRFPFRYMVDDYNLNYYAAFVGCSAETEASFETILFLSKKVDELKLNNVLTIEKSDEKIAKTIIDNTKSKNQKVLSMDSMQATTIEDADQGVSYIDVMTKNLDVLKEALQ